MGGQERESEREGGRERGRLRLEDSSLGSTLWRDTDRNRQTDTERQINRDKEIANRTVLTHKGKN